MTQGFDEYRGKLNTMQLLMSANCCRHAYEAGAASRQAEIDLLEKEIIETQQFLNNQNCIKQAEIDELQKRINDAIEILEYNEYVDSALQALDVLKGESNE